MLVQVNYLNNYRSVDVGPLLSALCTEVAQSGVDPTHLLVTLDWLQYRKNLRPPIDPRLYGSTNGDLDAERELAIDVRRLASVDLAPELQRALAYLYSSSAEGEGDERLPLEEFGRPSQSIIWSFNRLFWQHLSTWEHTFRKGFLAALPGGVSDGTDPGFWHDRLVVFLEILSDLDGRGLLPDEIYVLELGVGTGQAAKVWLDTFRGLCSQDGRDYYHRVRYLMADYSHDVLRTARETAGEHGEKVSCLNLDVADPLHALAFLRYKALFVHSCNLYDNLPTDEVARRGGKLYEVRVRAYLPVAQAFTICETHGLKPGELHTAIHRLLRIGPEYFDDVEAGVRFWTDVWDAVRLEERYVQIEDPGTYRLAPGVQGLHLDDLLSAFPGDIRLHLSSSALQSFINTLPLLHPRGLFQVQDLFIRNLEQYRGTFRGPGKMDGSTVNWLNGPLFSLVAEHLGYDVHFEPFTYRERSNTVILAMSQKE